VAAEGEPPASSAAVLLRGPAVGEGGGESRSGPKLPHGTLNNFRPWRCSRARAPGSARPLRCGASPALAGSGTGRGARSLGWELPRSEQVGGGGSPEGVGWGARGEPAPPRCRGTERGSSHQSASGAAWPPHRSSPAVCGRESRGSDGEG